MSRGTVCQLRRYGWLVVPVCALIVAGSTLLPAQAKSPVAGIWAGTLSSRSFASFPVSIRVVQDAHGNLSAHATMTHQCVQESKLMVTVAGSNVVMSGSDADGNTVTFRGSLDDTGKLLDVSFVMNGSATGRCETDSGKGSLNKQ